MQWQVKIRAWGRSVIHPDWLNGERRINRIYYIHSGSGYYDLGGVRTPLLHGHLYIFPENLRIIANTYAEDPLDHTYFDFDIVPCFILKEAICLEVAKYPLIARLLDVAHEMFYSYYDYNNNHFWTSDILNFINSTVQNLLWAVTQEVDLHIITDPRILDTLVYIQEHLDQELHVDLLASRLYLDKHYFIRLFTRITSQSPYNYIRSKRLNRAGSLLKRGYSAKDSAQMCGYDSYCAFSRAFKEYYGLSPAKYLEDIKCSGR